MRIAIINETSAADRNADIVAALEGRGHEIMNVGMKRNGEPPELSYNHTALMTALLLNLQRADLVVGGCGTGQGFLSAASQYPGVFCGHIINSLDSWLFAQINDGNCMSLMLNQGYGWASNVNLRFIFDAYLSVERGGGYPPHRQVPQKEYRATLAHINAVTHRAMAEIVLALPDEIVQPVLSYPNFWAVLDVDSITDMPVKSALLQRYLVVSTLGI